MLDGTAQIALVSKGPDDMKTIILNEISPLKRPEVKELNSSICSEKLASHRSIPTVGFSRVV